MKSNDRCLAHRSQERAADLMGELEPADLTQRLIELFREIDLDGDGQIVWEEFTNFILDKATRLGTGEVRS
jgi:Ca2+-binding EF-hand superfamily protein